MGGAEGAGGPRGRGQGREPRTAGRGQPLLGEWMTVDAAPVLLDLAKTAPEEKYQIRALRGYIRLARQFADARRRAGRDVPRRVGGRRARRREEAGRRSDVRLSRASTCCGWPSRRPRRRR